MANTMRLDPWLPPDNGRCGRGCCWTPYGCATNEICPCHPVTFNKFMEMITDE